MNYLRVEYLILIKSKDCFCDNVEAFNNLLKSNSNIYIQNNTIKYNQIVVGYDVQTGQVKEQPFFHVKFTYKLTNEFETDLNNYNQLLKSVRKVVHLLDIEFNCIWDDISLYYSTKAYPLINETENLMRKLITKFMITNVGIEWIDETLPKEIKSVVVNNKHKERKVSSNLLYQIDFIHLADFLFKPYPTQDINDFYKKIKQATMSEELNLEELRSFIPKSNWQRYFSEIVKCEDSHLQKQWEELYLLRCKVAHNNTVTKDDYEKVDVIVSDLREKLQEAVNKLEKIEISEDEKETIVENMAAVGEASEPRKRFLRALQAGGKEVSRELLDNNPYVNIAVAILEGWQSVK